MTCALISRTLGGVILDAVITEDHTAEMEIAEHPVERGAKVSDHAWRTPYQVKLSCVVDSPRAVSSWEALLQVQRVAEPFSLVTGLKVYQNMLLKSLEPTRDVTYSRVLYFDATCQEIIRVGTGGMGLGGIGGILGSLASFAGDGKFGNQTLNGDATSAAMAKSTVNRGQVQAREIPIPPSRPSLVNLLAGS